MGRLKPSMNPSGQITWQDAKMSKDEVFWFGIPWILTFFLITSIADFIKLVLVFNNIRNMVEDFGSLLPMKFR